jgi:hypothetical protein
MILTTHAIIGGAIASILPSHPLVAVTLSFASHFLVDAIPHWDYPIRSKGLRPGSGSVLAIDGVLLRDLMAIGADGLAGTALALVLFATRQTFWVVLLCAWAAMLPDPLQFLHNVYPRGPLPILQRFHSWIHTNYQIKREVFLGVSSQIVFVIVVVALARLVPQMFPG